MQHQTSSEYEYRIKVRLDGDVLEYFTVRIGEPPKVSKSKFFEFPPGWKDTINYTHMKISMTVEETETIITGWFYLMETLPIPYGLGQKRLSYGLGYKVTEGQKRFRQKYTVIRYTK